MENERVGEIVLAIFHINATRAAKRPELHRHYLKQLRNENDVEDFRAVSQAVAESCGSLPKIQFMPLWHILTQVDPASPRVHLPTPLQASTQVAQVERKPLSRTEWLGVFLTKFYFAWMGIVVIAVACGLLYKGLNQKTSKFPSGALPSQIHQPSLGMQNMTVQQSLKSKAVFKVIVGEDKWKGGGYEDTFDNMETYLSEHPELGGVLIRNLDEKVRELKGIQPLNGGVNERQSTR